MENETENQKGRKESSSTISHGILQDALSNKSRIHALFKCSRKYTRIEHIIVHETHFNRFFKELKSYSVLSDHSGVKLGMNKTGEPPNAWKLNSTLLSNPWVKEENLRGTKNIPRAEWRWKYN